MLREIYDAEFIKARYKCLSIDTARRYMRQMGATGRPLFVTEDMINQWELSKRKPCWTGKARQVPAGMIIPRRK